MNLQGKVAIVTGKAAKIVDQIVWMRTDLFPARTG